MPPDTRHAEVSRAGRAGVLVAGLLALLFTAALAAAPLLGSAGEALRAACDPLCHQASGRSLTLGGAPLAVCARCFGLYLGGTVGLLGAGLLRRRAPRPDRRWFFVAAALVAIDAVAGMVGLPSLPLVPRFFAAVPSGFVVGVFLAIGLWDLSSRLAARETRVTSEVIHG